MQETKIFEWRDLQFSAISAPETEQGFFNALTKAAKELGFEYCAYGMRQPLPFSNPKTVLLSNYSKQWQERYAQENYLSIDPTVAHALTSIQPLIWSDHLFEDCRPFWEEARGHGLRIGWAQSSFDAKGVAGMLSLARSNEALSAAELQHISHKMSWLVQAAHTGMASLQASQQPAQMPIKLTPREIEVLRWTADGKTSSEVGEIMHITERTVNFHVNNSLEKLGTANKTAGVLKAAILRLI